MERAIDIGQMPEIYQAAIVTIAACTSPSVRDGFLELYSGGPRHFTESLDRVFRVAIEVPDLGKTRPAEQDSDSSAKAKLRTAALFIPTRQVENYIRRHPEPLDTWGWALQEEVLSERIIKFRCADITWAGRCRCKDNVGLKLLPECYPEDLRQCHELLERTRHEFDKDAVKAWMKIVDKYSGLGLTFSQDRILAISGIAKRIGENTKNQYCAGLWLSCLADQLAWYDGRRKLRRPSTTVSPSWSWVSVMGRVSFLRNTVHAFSASTEILDVDTVLLHEAAPYGAVAVSRLRIRGWCLDAQWLPTPGPSEPYSLFLNPSLKLPWKSIYLDDEPERVLSGFGTGSATKVLLLKLLYYASNSNAKLHSGDRHPRSVRHHNSVFMILHEVSSGVWHRVGILFFPYSAYSKHEVKADGLLEAESLDITIV